MFTWTTNDSQCLFQCCELRLLASTLLSPTLPPHLIIFLLSSAPLLNWHTCVGFNVFLFFSSPTLKQRRTSAHLTDKNALLAT